MKLIKGNMVVNANSALKITRLMRDGYVPYHDATSADGAEKESIPSAAPTRRKTTTKKKVNK